jgi:PST family polysaccharide transporter
MLVMTWWIGPHAYGIFITAMSLTSFLASVARFGVDTYLIRCESTLPDREYEVAFTIMALSSAAALLAGGLAVPLVGRWLSQEEFVAPYLVLLATVPVTALAGLPIAKLERELNFRAVAGMELAGQFSASMLALVLALAGWGVWAPVFGMVAWQVVVLICASRLSGFRIRLAWDTDCARRMLVFGFGFSLSVRAWQLRSLVNPLVVAWQEQKPSLSSPLPFAPQRASVSCAPLPPVSPSPGWQKSRANCPGSVPRWKKVYACRFSRSGPCSAPSPWQDPG